MAKEVMVTRTVETTNIKVKALNVSTESVEDVTVVAPFSIKDSKKALAYAVKIAPESLKPFVLLDITYNAKRYGMSLKSFIENAKELTK